MQVFSMRGVTAAATLFLAAATVAQDDCTTAAALAAGPNGPFDLSLLTLSTPTFTCGSVSGADGWYTFATPALSGQLTIDTFGSAIDTVLEVWDACGGTVVACNDDAVGLQSEVSFATAPGATYIARVGRFGSTATGLFSINVTFSSPDDCAGALPIVDGLNGPFNTTGATTSAPPTTCSSINSDIWLVYTAPCNGSLTINTETAGSSPLSDTVMEIWDACGGVVLGCDDDGGPGLFSQITIAAATAGTQYFIRVGDFGTTSISQGVFNIRAVLTPSSAGQNDECACADPLVLGANPIDTTGSTVSSPAFSCAFVTGGDRWYSYTVAGPGCVDLTFDTLGSGVDTALELWDACGGNIVDCNDDIVFPPGESSVSALNASPGSTFLLRAGMFSGATGPFTVNVTETSLAPANDDCAGALAVSLGDNGPFNTACATTSTPAVSCGFNAGKDLWFSYTAACSAPHTFSTCVGDFDTVLEVWDVCGGAVLGCNDDNASQCGPGFRSSLTLPLVNGTTYLVRVAGYNGASGNFTLNVTTGTNTGSITNPSVVSACPSSATLSVTGGSNIGDTVTVDVLGGTGLVLNGYGFAPRLPIPTPCGCDVIGDGSGGLGFFEFTPTRNLTIPCATFFIGVSFDVQGVDLFPTSGGCTFSGIPFGATDIATIVIG